MSIEPLNPYQSPATTGSPLDASATIPYRPSVARAILLGMLGYGIYAAMLLVWAFIFDEVKLANFPGPFGLVFSIAFAISEVLVIERHRLDRSVIRRLTISGGLVWMALIPVIVVLDMRSLIWASRPTEGLWFSGVDWVFGFIAIVMLFSFIAASHLLFMLSVRAELLKAKRLQPRQ